MILRRVVDGLMAIALILLMSKQITEDIGHEYIGFIMIILLAVHLYLNRQWFKTLFKGRYTAVRVLTVTTNIAVLATFLLSGISGMLISESLMNLEFTESLTEL